MAFSLTSSWIEMADGVFPFFRVSVSRHICTGSELGDISPVEGFTVNMCIILFCRRVEQ